MIHVRSARLEGPPAGTSAVLVMAPLIGSRGAEQFNDNGDSRTAAGLSSGAPGVQATAQISLARDAATDSPVGWAFGWLSFARFQALDATYRGTTSNNGSVFARWYPENTWRQLRLDVAGGSGPWYTSHPQGLKRFDAGTAFESTVNLQFNDTPGQTILLATNNTAFPGRVIANWLHRVWFRVEFTTVLAAWEPSAPRPRALKSFDWSVEWRLEFTPNLSSPSAAWRWSPAQPQGKVVGAVVDGIPSAHTGIAGLFNANWNPPQTLQDFNRRYRNPHKDCFRDRR